MNPFLAAIIEAPDDDLPRLQYADYLCERGDIRGEFIRVQIELANMDRRHYVECTSTTKRAMESSELGKREHALWDANYREWHVEMPSWIEHVDFPVRGFFESIRCTARLWLLHADALTAEHPILRVTLTAWSSVDGVTMAREFATNYYRERWPRIQFTLPAEPRGIFTPSFQSQLDYPDISRELRDRIIRSFGVPQHILTGPT